MYSSLRIVVFCGRGNYCKIYLIIVSLYAWGACLCILLIVLLCKLFCPLASSYMGQSGKGLLILALSIKYYLFSNTGFSLKRKRPVGLNIGIPKIVLPIGISFYTFKITSYIDHLGKGDVQTSFAVFIHIPVSLMAGPVRYTIGDELTERNHLRISAKAQPALLSACKGDYINPVWRGGHPYRRWGWTPPHPYFNVMYFCYALYVYYDFGIYILSIGEHFFNRRKLQLPFFQDHSRILAAVAYNLRQL